MKRVILKFDKALIKVIRTLSVKARFFLMVIIISIIPILVIGVIAYKKSDTDIVNKISVYSLQIVKQLGLSINEKLFNWEQYGNIITGSEDMQDILMDFDKMSEAEQYLAGRTIQKIMREPLKVSLDILEPDIVTTNDVIISPMSYPNLSTSPFFSYMDGAEKIKEMTLDANGSYIWYTDDIVKNGYTGRIVLSRSIIDINTWKSSLGLLVLRVDTNYLYKLYENVNLGSGSRIYLLDPRFMVVLSEDKGEIGSSFSPEISNSIQKRIEQGQKDGTIKNANDKYLAAFSFIPVSGWTVVALIPNSYLGNLSNDIRDLVKTVILICIFVSLVIFMSIYRSITIPLNELIQSMREVRKGNLESKAMVEYAKDEVGEVALSYNQMISELNVHIEKIKAEEMQKMLAEFRALQAQINPHFIANTLNNVAWLAKMQKADNIHSVVTSLIQLLSASMGRGSDLVKIEEEIENIKSYICVQEFKYFKKIDIHIDMDEDVLKLKILRFILQPIIENAILHGIGPKQCKGYISLKGYIDNNDLAVIITDTGVGMEADEVERLLNDDKDFKDQFNSIGIKNVNERIKLSYGNKYGMRIKSQKNIFTSVEIKLPVIL